MARGDAIIQSDSVATGGFLTYQPAAGVEAMVTHIAGGSSGGNINVTAHLYNSTVSMIVLQQPQGSGANGPTPMKLIVNNTHHLRVQNNNSTTQSIAFSAIQTK